VHLPLPGFASDESVDVQGYQQTVSGVCGSSPNNSEPVLNKGFQNWNLLVLNMAAWLDGKPAVTEF